MKEQNASQFSDKVWYKLLVFDIHLNAKWVSNNYEPRTGRAGRPHIDNTPQSDLTDSADPKKFARFLTIAVTYR